MANAPHVPVHLDALGVCARKIIETMPTLKQGDIVVSNHPAFGGSHLPDVAVLAPVFAEGSDRPVAYLANRAHHAEIGEASPGSMPASTNCLAEEGVVISPNYSLRVVSRKWMTLRNFFIPVTILPARLQKIWPICPW